MKTKLLLIVLLTLPFTGCVSSNAAKRFAEFERLGITHATITGKFSNTNYVVITVNGVRTATLDHSNPWLTNVHIVRETVTDTSTLK